ncbi:hypothetical protein JB92DRAFT_2832900 [Gautieria morchelliformis]|nr:hypothetical protein JB92DRAFT_2832900 [Gautieria morchelliformis]
MFVMHCSVKAYLTALCSCWPQPPFPHDKLVAVLKLTTLYLMAPARDWAIDWLTSEELHPALRMQLVHQYNVDRWIEPAFRALLPCKLTSLSVEDTGHPGLRAFSALAKTKEVLQDLRIKTAFSATQLYSLAAECDSPTQCRCNWITWFWMRVSAKLLNPAHPLPLVDVPKVVMRCDTICKDCFNQTIMKVNKYPVLLDEERIVASTVQKLRDIQKKQ